MITARSPIPESCRASGELGAEFDMTATFIGIVAPLLKTRPMRLAPFC